MQIWETRYNSSKYGLESKASFKYFNLLLQQGYPYNMRVLAETLIKDDVDKLDKIQYKCDKDATIDYDAELEKTIQRKYNTIRTCSSKWDYRKRFNAYDEYLRQLHLESKEKAVMEWETEQLKLAQQRANIHNDTLKNIHEATEDQFPLTKKAYAEETNERAYNESLDAVYKILYGGIMKTDNKTQVKTEIKEYSTVNTIDKIKEADKDFADLYNPDPS